MKATFAVPPVQQKLQFTSVSETLTSYSWSRAPRNRWPKMPGSGCRAGAGCRRSAAPVVGQLGEKPTADISLAASSTASGATATGRQKYREKAAFLRNQAVPSRHCRRRSRSRAATGFMTQHGVVEHVTTGDGVRTVRAVLQCWLAVRRFPQATDRRWRSTGRQRGTTFSPMPARRCSISAKRDAADAIRRYQRLSARLTLWVSSPLRQCSRRAALTPVPASAEAENAVK